MRRSRIVDHALAELKAILHYQRQTQQCLYCCAEKPLQAFPSYSARYATKQPYCSDCIKSKKSARL